jgi:hypothetical protein
MRLLIQPKGDDMSESKVRRALVISRRWEAQDAIMEQIQKALKAEERKEKRQEMARQFNRIKRLFGYDEASWWQEPETVLLDEAIKAAKQ